MKQIYTPKSLYRDFSPDLPLKETFVSDERVDDIVYNEIYFNGRQTEEGRVLIYGIYAHHTDGKKHNAILVIPDYNEPLNVNFINIYALLGYDVLTFDYRGEVDGSESHTNYPSDIKYANLKYAGRHLDFADISAKETCWYEWCCVARYALSFLASRKETNKIGVLGVKNGSEIMWHVIATDDRVKCAVGLFGAGWRSYKNMRKYGNDAPEIDDERIRFIAGVDSHAYAPYCKCPVAFFTATNCAEFDADRAHDTVKRVNENVDKFFCLAPRMKDAVNINCMRNIEMFFGVYLNGQRIQIVSEPSIDISVSGESVWINVETPFEPKPRTVDMYVCENQIVPSRRNWTKTEEVERLSDSRFRSAYSLVNGGGMLYAFAVIEYRNGITVSTPITSKKCPKTPVIKTNLLYESAEGEGSFTFGVREEDLVAGAVYYRRSPIEMVKGPMGINGIASSSGLITYMPNENRVDIKPDSIFKLDIYCKKEITLRVSLVTEAGTERERTYLLQTPVPVGEVWQNVILALRDFKTSEGKTVTDTTLVDYIEFNADGFFAINNVLLI